jgi:hypothetical protein
MKQQKLSAQATRVLRLCARMTSNGGASYAALLTVVGGSWVGLADSLTVLERRFLIRMEPEAKRVRASKRGFDLLNTATYAGWGTIRG